MRCRGELLTMRQARTLLDVPPSTVRWMVRSGMVVPVRRRLRRRVRRRDLLAAWSSGPDLGGGEAGVREPRRPRPPVPASQLALPRPGSPHA